MNIDDLLKINPNFVQEGLDEVPSWLQSKENWMKFLSVYIERFKKLDDDLVLMAYGRLLVFAEGKVLDNIGQEFEVDREDMTDVQYRSAITLKIFSNTSGGTRPEIEDILQLLTGSYPLIRKGYKNNVQIILHSACLNLSTLGQQLEDLFPITANLEVCIGDRSVFGLTSVTDPDKFAGGMLGLTTVGKPYQGGGLCSLNYTTKNGTEYRPNSGD